MPTARKALKEAAGQVGEKATEVAKHVMTPELEAKRQEANAIIRRYTLFGTITSFIPNFGLDVVAATAVQTKMIKDMADVYGFDIDDQLLRTAITTGVTALGGRILTEIASTVATSFSPLKVFLGSATQAAVSGFLTLEIGNLYQSRMELGENPADIGIMDIVNHIVAQVQEGKWDPSKLSLVQQVGALSGN
ncbi:DUF697 domain-containing protein [Neolewinella agarilytica]|uniref:Uncharacterized conserved protein, DUF697 family n=1 Tax=Neolewinella agarilytica TaxID=478744 RepID=A0A1H9DU14_9BACT|nr:DUF697 domain-containing protein [Neolewinella agarilytica]SEQ16979.1 Uncharacterized conserved protein, DUF697 family [Neolewinella agarilytica]